MSHDGTGIPEVGQVNLGGGRRPNLFEECRGRGGYMLTLKTHTPGIQCTEQGWISSKSTPGMSPRPLLQLQGRYTKQNWSLMAYWQMKAFCISKANSFFWSTKWVLSVYLKVIGCPNCLQAIDTNPNAHKWVMKRFHAFQSLFLFLVEISVFKSS